MLHFSHAGQPLFLSTQLWSLHSISYGNHSAALAQASFHLGPAPINTSQLSHSVCDRQDAILLGRDLAAPSEPGAAKPSRHRSHAEPAAVAGSKRRALEEEFPVPKRQRGAHLPVLILMLKEHEAGIGLCTLSEH